MKAAARDLPAARLLILIAAPCRRTTAGVRQKT